MNEEVIIKLMTENFTTIVSLLSGFVGTVVGALATGTFNYFQNKSQQKSEERKHLATLTVNSAIEHWKRMHDGRKGEDVMPIDIYLVHMSKLAQEVLSESITKDNVAEKLKSVDDIVDAMKAYAYSTIKK